MGHLSDRKPIDISPFFDGSLSKLFLVKGKNALIVKCLKSEYCDNIDLITRFRNEARILESLNHQQTPQLVKVNLSRPRPYFAYEYIKGMTLETLLINNTLSLTQGIDITRQLLTILSDLHERNKPIIHSDISPANIVYSKEQQIHLIDFGCAKQLDHNNELAHTWIGRHAYLSPEQAQGHGWNASSDFFQVGLLAYEMLTGKRRNAGITVKELLPLAANPAPLEFEHIDSPYQLFLSTLLSTDIDKRFQSCADALLELNKL